MVSLTSNFGPEAEEANARAVGNAKIVGWTARTDTFGAVLQVRKAMEAKEVTRLISFLCLIVVGFCVQTFSHPESLIPRSLNLEQFSDVHH